MLYVFFVYQTRYGFIIHYQNMGCKINFKAYRTNYTFVCLKNIFSPNRWGITRKKFNRDSVTLLGEYLKKNRKGTSLYSII